MLLVIAACSGGGDGSAISYPDFEMKMAAEYCSYSVRCGIFPDTSTCLAVSGAIVRTDIEDAIAGGRIVFDANNALACLTAYANQSCDMTIARSGPIECGELFDGAVAANGSCALDDECISNSCTVPSCGGGCCQGTCVGDIAPSPLPTGAACGYDAQCVTGDFCDLPSGTCQPFVAVGSACNYLFACTPGNGCVNQVCKTLPRTGEPCPEGACTNVGDTCGSTGVCVPFGQPGDSCASSSCAPYFTCDVQTLTCTTGPTLGQPCSQSCFGTGLYCTDEIGAEMPVCAQLGSGGASCGFDAECLDYDCATGSCATPTTCW
ncbi:MAG TPA: Dickkopf N-terminal cysteine-rich domain-containing protein [Kofleriaceae bacterium]